MTVNTKQMVGVRVETKLGQPLGKVASFDLDAETGRLDRLRVKASGMVAGLLEDELLIPWSAILEVTEKLVVVADATVQGAIAMRVPASVPSPTLMREG